MKECIVIKKKKKKDQYIGNGMERNLKYISEQKMQNKSYLNLLIGKRSTMQLKKWKWCLVNIEWGQNARQIFQCSVSVPCIVFLYLAGKIVCSIQWL